MNVRQFSKWVRDNRAGTLYATLESSSPDDFGITNQDMANGFSEGFLSAMHLVAEIGEAIAEDGAPVMIRKIERVTKEIGKRASRARQN